LIISGIDRELSNQRVIGDRGGGTRGAGLCWGRGAGKESIVGCVCVQPVLFISCYGLVLLLRKSRRRVNSSTYPNRCPQPEGHAMPCYVWTSIDIVEIQFPDPRRAGQVSASSGPQPVLTMRRSPAEPLAMTIARVRTAANLSSLMASGCSVATPPPFPPSPSLPAAVRALHGGGGPIHCHSDTSFGRNQCLRITGTSPTQVIATLNKVKGGTKKKKKSKVPCAASPAKGKAIWGLNLYGAAAARDRASDAEPALAVSPAVACVHAWQNGGVFELTVTVDDDGCACASASSIRHRVVLNR